MIWLLSACVIASCGKDPSSAEVPNSNASLDDSPAPVRSAGDGTGEGGETGEAEREPSQPRVELDAEFHRTRTAHGSGLWVLGVVHNPHAQPVTDVRLGVTLLDEAEAIVGQADGRIRRALKPGERAGVAVLVPKPVPHEQLRLAATAIVNDGVALEPLALHLDHDPPQRADFGGWFVIGRVQNSGSVAVEGARIEIQGLDKSGKLLGIDWLKLDPVAAGEAVEFEVGDLRYEEVPAQFLLEVRGPPV